MLPAARGTLWYSLAWGTIVGRAGAVVVTLLPTPILAAVVFRIPGDA